MEENYTLAAQAQDHAAPPSVSRTSLSRRPRATQKRFALKGIMPGFGNLPIQHIKQRKKQPVNSSFITTAFTTLLLFIVTAVGAQTGNIAVGTGIGTNTTLPLDSYFGFNYSQQIVTKAEYNASQGISGNITKIRVYCTSVGSLSTAWNDWRIYLGHTSKTSFTSTSDWVPLAQMTQVYDGAFTPAAGSWIEFTLATPFNYNNTDNLVVAIYEKAASFTSSSSRATFYSYTSGSNTGIYLRNDTSSNVNPSSPAAASGRTSTLAQLQFTGAVSQTPYFLATAPSGFGNVCINTTSAAGSFTLTGNNLSGNVTIGALTGYTYNTTQGGSYTETLSLTPTAGSISQTIYVKLSPTVTTTGAYNGNIPISGGGVATTTNVAVTGAGVNTAPTLSSAGSAGTITTSSATITGATVSNVNCSAITAYGIEYSTTPAFLAGSGTPLAGTGLTNGAAGSFSANLTALTPNTTYYYRAFATNSGNTTYYPSSTPLSFLTSQIVGTLDFSEDFEGANNWTIVNGSYTNKWFIGTAANNGGTKSLYISDNTSGTTNNYTITSTSAVQAYRDIAIPAGTNTLELSFDWKANGEGTTTLYDYLRVWMVPTTYTPSGAITTGTGRTVIGSFNSQTAYSRYVNASLNASTFAGQSMRLVFEWINDGSTGLQTPASVDNISLKVPSCASPTPGTSAFTATTGTINWTAPAAVPANGYEYYYSTTSTAPLNTSAIVTANRVTGTSVTINGLTTDTTYYWWIRSLCSGTSTSAWISGGSFFTGYCVTVPGTVNNVDTVTNVVVTPTYGTVYSNPSANVSPNYVSYNNTPIVLYRGTTNNTIAITFGTHSTQYNAVWIDYNQNLSFEASEAIAVATTATGGSGTATYTFNIPADTPLGNTRLRVRGGDDTAYTAAGACTASAYGETEDYVVTIANAPTCYLPTAVAVAANSITHAAATATWSAPAQGTTVSYQYEVRTAGNPGAAGAVIANSTTTTSAAFTGLTQGTTYQVYVRSFCGGTDYSAWSSATTFTTQTVTPVTWTEPFTTASLPANWTNNGFSIGTATAIGTADGRANYAYRSLTTANPSFGFTTINVGPLGNNDRLKIDYKFAQNADPYGAVDAGAGNFTIEYSIDYGATWSALETVLSTAEAGWKTYTRAFGTSYNGKIVKLRLTGNKLSGSNFTIAFDNFIIEPIPSCEPVSGLTSSAVQAASATINWAASVSAPASGYEYYYATTTTAPAEGTTGTAVAAGVLTANINGLSANTTYYAWVRSVCDASNKGAWVGPLTFRTDCSVVTAFPYTENFEAPVAPAAPDCWTVIDANNDGDKWITYNDATYAHGGTKSIGLYTDINGGLNNDWLITPALSLTANQRLRFWIRARSTGEPNDYTVKLSSTGRAAADFTTTLQALTTVSNTTYQEVIINLSAYTGTTYIAFHVPQGGLDGYYLYIDDVTVENIPSCLEVSSPVASATGPATATISWTAPATAPSAGYEYYLGTTAAAPVEATAATGSTAAGITTKSLTDLTASTTYYLWVRSVCDGSKSVWTGGSAFTTLCNPVTTFTQNFDAAITMPSCWSKVGTNGTVNVQTSSSSTAPNCLYMYSTLSTSRAVVSMPPVANAGSNTHWLKFNYRANYSAGETLEVGYLTNPLDAATFVAVNTITVNSTTYTAASVDLGTAPGANQYIAFRTGTMTYSILIDDVSWELKPTCLPPTALTVPTILATQVTASWTAPAITSPASYQYEIRQSGDAGSGETGLAASGSVTAPAVTATVSGLLPDTAYFVYVRSVCGGELTAWTSPAAIRTQAVTPVVWNEPFTAATLPNGWTNNATVAWTIGTSTSIGTATNGNYITRALNSTNTTSSFTTINIGPLGANDRFKFDYKVALNNGDPATAATGSFKVEMSVDYGQTWTTLETVANSSLTDWHTRYYNLAAQVSKTVKFRITGTRDSSNPNYAFDNFVIEPAPACAAPTVLTTSAIASTTVNVSWTAPGIAPANGYEYYLATVATVPAANAVATGAVAAGSTLANITTLTPNTLYYIWVRSYCDDITKSDWSVYTTFTTSKAEPSNYATAFAVSAATAAAIDFSWTAAAAGTQVPDGYVLTGSTTNPAATPADGTDAANANLATATPIRKVTGGTATTGTLNGGTAGTMYYFKNVPYTNSGTSIDFKTDGTVPALNYATKPGAATAVTLAGTTSTTATLSWTLPATFDAARHQVLVFVKQGTSVTAGTPTLSPAGYTASAAFNTPGTAYQGDGAAYAVYNGDGTSVSLTGLTQGTAYAVHIAIVMEAANYDNTYSYSAAATASATMPGLTTVVWTEGFTSATLPSGWVNTTLSWSLSNTLPSIGTDTYYIYKNLYSQASSGNFTTINVGPLGSNDRLVFKYKAANSSSPYSPPAVDSGNFTVQISTNYGSTWTTLETVSNNAVAGWQTKIYSLASYNAQIVQVKIAATRTAGDYMLAFDDFKIEPVPSCDTPGTPLAANLVAATSATISWGASSSAPAGGYEYYYSTTNTAPLATAAIVPAQVVSSTSAALTALSSNTQYYWWARALCGTGDSSGWISGPSFLTSQTPATFAYTENFEGTNNWTFVNGEQPNKWYVGTATNNGGSKALYISNDNGATNAYTIGTASVTQVYRDIAIPFGTSTVALSFDWKAMGETGTNNYDYFRVWLVPATYLPVAGTQITADSATGRTQVGTFFVNQETFTTYVSTSVNVSAFAGNTVRLVFEWRNDGSYGAQPAAAIDNVSVKNPCGATVTAATGASRCGTGTLTLSATASAGTTEYRWYSSASGGTLLATTTTGSWTTPSLSNTTTYYVAAFNGTCESDQKTAVTATIIPAPADFTLATTVTPVGADACSFEYAQLNINGNSPVNTFTEGFEAVSTAWSFGFTGSYYSSALYRETYRSQGNYSAVLAGYGEYYYESGESILTLSNGVNLTQFGGATITFDHICASEAAGDFGYVQYSTDGGTTWVSFPASSYVGTGVLKNGVVSFDKSSYTDWNAQFVDIDSTPGAEPAAGLFKTETLNLTPYLTSTNFKIRFRLTYDYDTDYYGWLIDNVKINATPKITWSPAAGLYTNSALTTAYVAGTNASVLYASPNGLQTYTASATIGSCPKIVTTTVENRNKRFTGTGTDWSLAANWTPAGVPTAADCVTIPGTKAVTLASGTALSNNLKVNAGGSLSVATGATLNVNNVVTVDAAGTLTVANNGALLQGAATATNDNAGKITIHKSANPLYRMDYTMWSSPVAAQNLLAFSPATASGRFFEYKYGQSNGTWIEGYWPVTPGDHSFEAAKGYLIRMPNENGLSGYNAGTATLPFDGVFTGIPNNGNVNIALSTAAGRYTAVGNPYPSPISVADFFTANSGKLHGTTGLYLWRKRNNSASASYATLTQAGYIANPDDSTTSATNLGSFYQGANATVGNWLISQGQGFIVKTASGLTAPQLNFTNSMRRAAPGATQGFFRTVQSTASKLWMNLKAQNGTASQVLIAYMEEGTLGLDYGYDGLKLGDGNTVSFYSVAESTSLAIQARPEFNPADVVPMGFTVPTAGQFTIGLDHTEGVFNQDQVIYLKDNTEGIIRNITDHDYTFTSEAGTFEGRFEVVYRTSALGTDNPTVDPDTVVVYKQGNTISINTGNTLINGVTIFDIRGRELYSANGINDTKAAVNNLNIAQQVIIVEVNTVKGKVSKRIVY